MQQYKKHDRCLISNSTDLRHLKGYEKNYLVKSFPVGFVFCSRIPTEGELVTYYQQYPEEPYLSPVTIKRYNELLDDFEKYKQTGNILDVGCGTGYFLIEAEKRGWRVYGTEYTDKQVELCSKNGIKVQKGRLNSEWYSEGMFDVVISLEVLEHINNPLEEVRHIYKVLRKGGLFYFTTPNFNSSERYFLKSDYNIITYPEHLCYYTKKTINYLLTNNGFGKKKLETTGISLSHIRTSRKADSESLNSPSSTDEVIRNLVEKNPLLNSGKRSVNLLLSFLGIGNSLKGWYEKV